MLYARKLSYPLSEHKNLMSCKMSFMLHDIEFFGIAVNLKIPCYFLHMIFYFVCVLFWWRHRNYYNGFLNDESVESVQLMWLHPTHYTIYVPFWPCGNICTELKCGYSGACKIFQQIFMCTSNTVGIKIILCIFTVNVTQISTICILFYSDRNITDSFLYQINSVLFWSGCKCHWKPSLFGSLAKKKKKKKKSQIWWWRQMQYCIIWEKYERFT
jgi:hypothetical protein